MAYPVKSGGSVDPPCGIVSTFELRFDNPSLIFGKLSFVALFIAFATFALFASTFERPPASIDIDVALPSSSNDLDVLTIGIFFAKLIDSLMA